MVGLDWIRTWSGVPRSVLVGGVSIQLLIMEGSIGTEDTVCQASISTTTTDTEATKFRTSCYKDEDTTATSTGGTGSRQEESTS